MRFSARHPTKKFGSVSNDQGTGNQSVLREVHAEILDGEVQVKMTVGKSLAMYGPSLRLVVLHVVSAEEAFAVGSAKAGQILPSLG